MGDNFFEELLARVKRGGRLSDVELSAVRNALESATTDDDPYTLLHIIGKAATRASRP